jgi:hypothetical protein
MSGMNAEGVAVVVHGGRAGEPRTDGEPVLHSLRRVLGEATTADEAVATFGERDIMVSHIVVLADATGKTAVVERVPGEPPHVRWLDERAVVTNHFEGPAANDEKNLRVRQETSTLARRERGDEVVEALEAPVDAESAVGALRDRRGVGGVELPLGDRRAIDALIATHGVVMDTRERILWVSESPHLLGRFVAFDLKQLLDERYDPRADDEEIVSIPADPLLSSDEYERIESAR